MSQPLDKNKTITTEEALKILRITMKNHPENIEVHGLPAIQNLIKLGVDAEREKWAAAVNYLKEQIDDEIFYLSKLTAKKRNKSIPHYMLRSRVATLKACKYRINEAFAGIIDDAQRGCESGNTGEKPAAGQAGLRQRKDSHTQEPQKKKRKKVGG